MNNELLHTGAVRRQGVFSTPSRRVSSETFTDGPRHKSMPTHTRRTEDEPADSSSRAIAPFSDFLANQGQAVKPPPCANRQKRKQRQQRD